MFFHLHSVHEKPWRQEGESWRLGSVVCFRRYWHDHVQSPLWIYGRTQGCFEYDLKSGIVGRIPSLLYGLQGTSSLWRILNEFHFWASQPREGSLRRYGCCWRLNMKFYFTNDFSDVIHSSVHWCVWPEWNCQSNPWLLTFLRLEEKKIEDTMPHQDLMITWAIICKLLTPRKFLSKYLSCCMKVDTNAPTRNVNKSRHGNYTTNLTSNIWLVWYRNTLVHGKEYSLDGDGEVCSSNSASIWCILGLWKAWKDGQHILVRKTVGFHCQVPIEDKVINLEDPIINPYLAARLESSATCPCATQFGKQERGLSCRKRVNIHTRLVSKLSRDWKPCRGRCGERKLAGMVREPGVLEGCTILRPQSTTRILLLHHPSAISTSSPSTLFFHLLQNASPAVYLLQP